MAITTQPDTVMENAMINSDSLQRVADGDPTLLQELLATFFQSTREDILNLKAAVNNHQNTLVASFAHRIKGGAVIVGAEQLALLADNLEHCGQQVQTERYEPLFLELQDTFRQIESQYPGL